jgi:type III secretion protein J
MRVIRIAPALLSVLVLGCQARVQGGLDEAEANEIQSLLIEGGFDARKVPEPGKKPAWAIEVDPERARDAARVLTDLGLPRKKLTGLDSVQTGLLATPSQERLSELHARSDELVLTLQSIAGVTLARVHLVIPPPPRPGQPPGHPKAAAMLRVRPGHGPRVRALQSELRTLISGSVEGLAPDDVSLLFDEVAAAAAPPGQPGRRAQRVRYLVIGLGTLVSVLALLLVNVGLRMRSLQAAGARS